MSILSLDEEELDVLYRPKKTVVFFAGAHGVGKTSIAKHVTERLYTDGYSVCYVPEMTYIPKSIVPGTEQFQNWYRMSMMNRDITVRSLVEASMHPMNIVVDRLPQDVDVYDNVTFGHGSPRWKTVSDISNEIMFYLRTLSTAAREKGTDLHIICFFVMRDYEAVERDIRSRMEVEEYRKNWSEDDQNRWLVLDEMFMDIMIQTMSLVDTMSGIDDTVIDVFALRNNGTVEDAVQDVMDLMDVGGME